MNQEQLDRLIRAQRIGKKRQRALLDTGLSIETEFTCDTCPLALDCESAFDPYNTYGDCLEEK